MRYALKPGEPSPGHCLTVAALSAQAKKDGECLVLELEANVPAIIICPGDDPERIYAEWMELRNLVFRLAGEEREEPEEWYIREGEPLPELVPVD